MNERVNAREAWIKRLSIRSSLAADDISAVRALRADRITVGQSRDFVRLGERSSNVHLLAAGVAAQFGQGGNGTRQIVALHLPGDMTDLASVVLPNACCAQTALSEVTLLVIQRNAICELASRNWRLAIAFWRDCSVNGAMVEQWRVRVGIDDAVTRLAAFLCELGVRNELTGGSRTSFTIPVSQDHIGQAIGITSVHTNRTFRDLERTGMIERTLRQVTITDWSAMARLGEFDPGYLHLPDTYAT